MSDDNHFTSLRSNSLIASATVSSRSLAYTSRVIFVLLCPRTFDTISMSTPLFSSMVAPVCLAQWLLNGFSMPAITARTFRHSLYFTLLIIGKLPPLRSSTSQAGCRTRNIYSCLVLPRCPTYMRLPLTTLILDGSKLARSVYDRQVYVWNTNMSRACLR